MPFDNAKVVVLDEVDELTALGITPVPDKVLQAHKDRMTRKYAARTYARWEAARVSLDRLTWQLSHPMCITPRLTPRAAAPHAVIAIADIVRRAVPSASFTVGYFETDPYLRVHYGAGKTACLGIWLSRRRLKAIARRTSDPSEAVIRLRTYFTG